MSRKVAIVSHWIPSCAQSDDLDLSHVYGGLEAYVIAAMLQLENSKIYWIGCNPNQVEPFKRKSHQASNNLDLEFLSLGIDKNLFSQHDSYWRDNIWLQMHGLPNNSLLNQSLEESWVSFSVVQERLAAFLAEIHRCEEIDYLLALDMQVSLVGQKLTETGCDIPDKTLFVPTPFPPKEQFQCIPHAHDLRLALEKYSKICLQTANGLDNLSALLCQNQGFNRGYFVVPCRIPQQSVNLLSEEDNNVSLLRRDKTNMVWAGRVDPSKLPVQALEAMKIVLLDKDNQERVNFIFIGQPTGYLQGIYGECQEAVIKLCSELGDKYPESFFYKQGLNRNQLLALLRQADGCVVNSYADGFNIIALEFLYLQQRKLEQQHGSKPFGLLLSESAGVYDSLFSDPESDDSLVLREPFSAENLADKIQFFLRMSNQQCERIFRQELNSLENTILPGIFDVVFHKREQNLVKGCLEALDRS